MKHSICIAFIFSFAFMIMDCCHVVARELDYELSGEITVMKKEISGKNMPLYFHSPKFLMKYKYDIWVKSTNWAIKTTPVNHNDENSVNVSTETGCDGVNIYSVHVVNPKYNYNYEKLILSNMQYTIRNQSNTSSVLKMNEEMLENSLNKKAKAKTKINAIGGIYSLLFPRFEISQEFPLWLAFCSSYYIDTHNDQRMPYVKGLYSSSLQYSNITTPSILKRNELYPYLPLYAALLEKRRQFLKNGEIAYDPKEVYSESNHLFGCFTALSITNKNDVHVPYSFRYEVYSGETNKNTGEQIPQETL